MFQSDDFDEVLSQFEIPGITRNNESHQSTEISNEKISSSQNVIDDNVDSNVRVLLETNINNFDNHKFALNTIDKKKVNAESLINDKRKMIINHFGNQRKRKFPGPAGLLTGSLNESKDEEACQIEVLSQDIDYSTTNENIQIFESSLWKNLIDYVRESNLGIKVDSVKSIKQQALSGNLRKRKAQIITALVEAIDRSATDPLVILRDSSGSIECTLHRDAWSSFSSYILSDFCALALWKPTVLTTGGAFKKHYLNITLSNILAIYSSAILKNEEKPLPEGYTKTSNDQGSIIKVIKNPSLETESTETIGTNLFNMSDDILEGLDESSFEDNIFP